MEGGGVVVVRCWLFLKGTCCTRNQKKDTVPCTIRHVYKFVVVNNLDQFSHVSQRSTLTRFQTAKAAQVK